MSRLRVPGRERRAGAGLRGTAPRGAALHPSWRRPRAAPQRRRRRRRLVKLRRRAKPRTGRMAVRNKRQICGDRRRGGQDAARVSPAPLIHKAWRCCSRVALVRRCAGLKGAWRGCTDRYVRISFFVWRGPGGAAQGWWGCSRVEGRPSASRGAARGEEATDGVRGARYAWRMRPPLLLRVRRTWDACLGYIRALRRHLGCLLRVTALTPHGSAASVWRMLPPGTCGRGRLRARKAAPLPRLC